MSTLNKWIPSVETNASRDEWSGDKSTRGLFTASGFCLAGVEWFNSRECQIRGLIVLNIAFRLVRELRDY